MTAFFFNDKNFRNTIIARLTTYAQRFTIIEKNVRKRRVSQWDNAECKKDTFYEKKSNAIRIQQANSKHKSND